MKTSASIAIVFLLIASTAHAADLSAQVDQLAKPYIDSKTVVGMSIGIVQGDKTVVRGYGKLADDGSQTPDGKTIYEIGSISKVFTGLLLADAMVDGRVSLVTPVKDLLPEGSKMLRKDDGQPIRLWHLSTHTSGLPRLPDNLKPADPNNPYADYTPGRLAEFLTGYQPVKKPGESTAYSNLGAGLLGQLLAVDRKTDYATLLQERIATPLQLDDTRIVLSAEQQKRFAAPHMAGGVAGHAWDFDALAGAGAIRSSVDDMLKFAAAQLDPPADKLGCAIDIAWQIQQKPLDKNDFAMGLGWHVARDGSTRWHNGETGGYHSSMFVSRKLDAAVVVLSNTATSEVDVLAEQLMRLLAGANEQPREFKSDPNELKIAPEKLQRLAGKYRLAPGFDFTVTAQADKLLVGLTGQPTLQVYPRSETEWFYKVVDATLTFQVDKSGRCTAVELFQNGVRQTAKRVGKSE